MIPYRIYHIYMYTQILHNYICIDSKTQRFGYKINSLSHIYMDKSPHALSIHAIIHTRYKIFDSRHEAHSYTQIYIKLYNEHCIRYSGKNTISTSLK